MSLKKITFRILRYKRGHIDPPRYQEYAVQVEPLWTVLDALEKIRLEQDATLMYRHSCHHSACGTCACKINGSERLACATRIQELSANLITLEPIAGFPCIGDLAVDISSLYEKIPPNWSNLRDSDHPRPMALPAGVKHFTRFENCIECGACISACPVVQKSEKFSGPAMLAALRNELIKSPQKSEALLSLAGGENGEGLCERALNCSRVCPTQVYPAKHIWELRQLVERPDRD